MSGYGGIARICVQRHGTRRLVNVRYPDFFDWTNGMHITDFLLHEIRVVVVRETGSLLCRSGLPKNNRRLTVSGGDGAIKKSRRLSEMGGAKTRKVQNNEITRGMFSKGCDRKDGGRFGF